ncbi:hypothetical protein LG651_15375 [Tamlana sp. 62-3]|uniref:Uncharacterized protein n=1 Tax=Neotamlana sargassicola TaxID=2883125 RepID=A0A9X1I889_9FLAO|nr:hypothetical protein [Tamlana sargassicola]MCB4809636.1 hypothetical protein [Tamlana sargassicola]
MTNFEKADIEPLDFIIAKCLETNWPVTAEPLIKKGFIKLTDNQGYGTLITDFEVRKRFVRYLYILDSYGVCECNFNEDSESARANNKTEHFQKQGGFKKEYKELRKNKRPLTTYQIIYLPIFIAFGLIGAYKTFFPAVSKSEHETLKSDFQTLKTQYDSIVKLKKKPTLEKLNDTL